MRIKWENITVLFFLILLIVLIVKSHLVAFFCQSVESLMYRDEPMYGIACIGILSITIVGIFAIMSNRKH